LILFIISALIQPCLEEIANKANPSFFEKWWQAQCPICGRRPIVARLKARKRYLICTLCGSEYLADQFLCVNCGNTDPASLKFLAPEGHLELRVDFCVKCKHYLKVIDQDKLKKAIPKGLEDIITIDLDFMAKNFGLIRV
ncbi:MAG: formate dehydrogenase accessory protein FdhE, partial [Nitrososphaerales archaeon]|nr:formate dehydrogenase accessory protein FdhE [Nitrososphaerales archaeon]